MCIWHNQDFLLTASEVRGLSRTLYCQDWLSRLSPTPVTGLTPYHREHGSVGRELSPDGVGHSSSYSRFTSGTEVSAAATQQLVRSTRKMSPPFLMARVLGVQHRGRAGTPQTLTTAGSEEDRRKERGDTEGKHREISREK